MTEQPMTTQEHSAAEVYELVRSALEDCLEIDGVAFVRVQEAIELLPRIKPVVDPVSPVFTGVITWPQSLVEELVGVLKQLTDRVAGEDAAAALYDEVYDARTVLAKVDQVKAGA